jgi:hypothetical protein
MSSLSMVDMLSRTSMADKPKKSKWIKKAVPESRKGVFGAKAKEAGMSTAAYAEKEKGAPGKLGKEARLAQTFEGMRKKKRSPLYDRKD